MDATTGGSRLALNTATTKHLTLEQAAGATAAAGLGWIGPWRDRVQEVGAARARQILADHGLRASTLCRGGFLTAADPSAREAALQDNLRALEEAATIGATELVMVVGGLPAATVPGGRAAPYTAADGVDPGRDLAQARQWVADAVAQLVPHARSHGVRLALEPLHPMFAADRAVLSSLDQALDLAAPFAPEVVGVVVDAYHVWWDPRLTGAVARAGAEGRLASYQVCDWVLPFAAEPLNSRGHVGDGYVDFVTLTRAVAAAGYRGPIEVEIFNEDIWSRPADQTLATMVERYERHVVPFL